MWTTRIASKGAFVGSKGESGGHVGVRDRLCRQFVCIFCFCKLGYTIIMFLAKPFVLDLALRKKTRRESPSGVSGR